MSKDFDSRFKELCDLRNDLPRSAAFAILAHKLLPAIKEEMEARQRRIETRNAMLLEKDAELSTKNEEVERLRTRVWGTISGGNLCVRGYHDKGDVGSGGEPWVVAEESGTHWSCYDVTFTPDAERITELRDLVSRLSRQLDGKLENSDLVKGLRRQLVERYERIESQRAYHDSAADSS